MATNTDPNFDNHYLIFGHGLRLRYNKNKITNFTLNSNYRVVTLHKPGKEIFTNLVKIITNQIESKSQFINRLFDIKCPIALGLCIKDLENLFITDYVINMYNSDSTKIAQVLDELSLLEKSKELVDNNSSEEPSDLFIFDSIFDEISIKNLDDLKCHLKKLNYSQIKENLFFEINIYKPNEACPKLLLDFTVQKKLGYINGGIYTVNQFKNFDYDTYEIEVIAHNDHKSNELYNEKLNSVIAVNTKKDNVKQYVFDESDVSSSNKVSFFKTIEEKIPSGLLIVLSCGSYKDVNDVANRKYLINYD